jgi:hypothetical protein
VLGREEGTAAQAPAREDLQLADGPVVALVAPTLLIHFPARIERLQELRAPRCRLARRHVHRLLAHAAGDESPAGSILARRDDQHVEVQLIGDELVEDELDLAEVLLDVGGDRVEMSCFLVHAGRAIAGRLGIRDLRRGDAGSVASRW